MSCKEIVIISGKGGTGKTTMTASLIPFYENIVIADCDVDAPDLDILLSPKIIKTEDFIATSKAVIDYSLCTNCGKCLDICKFEAIHLKGDRYIVNDIKCEGCNTCSLVCMVDAIALKPYKTGEIFESKTDYGDMIHARLTPGEEVSGRLVSEVRKRAKKRAIELGADVILIDGPPGIACNVISAITGCSLAIIVTEPTISGFHDLQRVQETAEKLSVNCAVIINKSDLSAKYSKKIKEFSINKGIDVLGEIPLSDEISNSINKKEIPQLDDNTIINRLMIEY